MPLLIYNVLQQTHVIHKLSQSVSFNQDQNQCCVFLGHYRYLPKMGIQFTHSLTCLCNTVPLILISDNGIICDNVFIPILTHYCFLYLKHSFSSCREDSIATQDIIRIMSISVRMKALSLLIRRIITVWMCIPSEKCILSRRN